MNAPNQTYPKLIPFKKALRRLMPQVDKASDRQPRFTQFVKDKYVPREKLGNYDQNGKPLCYTEDERQVLAWEKIEKWQSGLAELTYPLLEKDFRGWWHEHLRAVRRESGATRKSYKKPAQKLASKRKPKRR